MKGTGNFYVTESKYPPVKIIETTKRNLENIFEKTWTYLEK